MGKKGRRWSRKRKRPSKYIFLSLSTVSVHCKTKEFIHIILVIFMVLMPSFIYLFSSGFFVSVYFWLVFCYMYSHLWYRMNALNRSISVCSFFSSVSLKREKNFGLWSTHICNISGSVLILCDQHSKFPIYIVSFHSSCVSLSNDAVGDGQRQRRVPSLARIPNI